MALEVFEKMWNDVLSTGDFTLGKAVTEFEERFAKMCGSKYAIGVANGTDAIKLPLKMCGVGPGDEVITAANTFVASAGAIVECGATPRFVDMCEHYVLDSYKLESAITEKTKAIVPVSFTGEPCEMDEVLRVADKYKLHVVEDNCQGVLASYKGKFLGNFGIAGAISLHPLKNLNVWGDGGVIMTSDDEMNRKLRLYRNHGMFDRDTITMFGLNSRLDSLQAVVGNYLIDSTPGNVEQRRRNAAYYDMYLKDVPGVFIVPRRTHAVSSFHLYFFEVDEAIRNDLYQYLLDAGIEAKIHYPTPLYLQPGLQYLGYKEGDFPVADRQAKRYITLMTDEHLNQNQMYYCVSKVREFMCNKPQEKYLY